MNFIHHNFLWMGLVSFFFFLLLLLNRAHGEVQKKWREGNAMYLLHIIFFSLCVPSFFIFLIGLLIKILKYVNLLS